MCILAEFWRLTEANKTIITATFYSSDSESELNTSQVVGGYANRW